MHVSHIATVAADDNNLPGFGMNTPSNIYPSHDVGLHEMKCSNPPTSILDSDYSHVIEVSEHILLSPKSCIYSSRLIFYKLYRLLLDIVSFRLRG